MKSKFLALIPVALIGLLLAGFAYVQIGDPNADVSPTVNNEFVSNEADTLPPPGFPFPTVFNFNYSTVGGMNGGTVGAMWLNGKYYFNRWNGTTLYRYNDNGPGGGPGTLADSLTYIGSVRDLATDGTYLYGGPASTVLYRIDPNTGATLKTFTLAGGSTRAVAYDPNRKGFWNTNFGGNIFFHDTNGVLKQTITSTLTAKYGMGFDSTSSPDSAFLWVWNQGSGSTTNELYKIHIQSGIVKASYIFTLTGASIGIAGGAEVLVKDNKLMILLNYQNFALVGYKMKDLAPPAPSVWSEQTSPLTTALYSVSAVDDFVAWACGAAGKVVRTTNKGVNWVNVSGDLPASGDLYNIFALNSTTAIATSSPAAGTYIYRTTNGGTNWVQTLFQAGGFCNALWMTDANNAYAVGDPVGGNWFLKRSTNGGVNWTDWATVPTTQAGWNNSLMIVGNNVWFGTNANYLMYSSNMGANWSQQTTTFTNQYAVWFNSATVGLAGYNALNVTTNGGANWAALTSPVATNVGGITGSGSDWWVATQNTTIHYSSNNGSAWSTQYTAPDGVWYHINKSRSGNTIWAVRSNGKIARYGTALSVSPISTTTPTEFSLSQNYPNPFNPTTNINFSIPKSGLVTMKVFNILGKEVATLVNGNYNAGSYTVDFNASNLASGVYFYKIEVNGFSEVKRMMLVK